MSIHNINREINYVSYL